MKSQNENLSQEHWVWIVYTFIVCFFISRKIHILYSQQSPQFLYYFILRSIYPLYTYVYFLNITQTFLSPIHIVPLVCYIYRIHFLRKEIWQSLLICKLIFDITGHSYEINYLTSLYHYKPIVGILVAIGSIATYIPLYIGCYKYAFKDK